MKRKFTINGYLTYCRNSKINFREEKNLEKYIIWAGITSL